MKIYWFNGEFIKVYILLLAGIQILQETEIKPQKQEITTQTLPPTNKNQTENMLLGNSRNLKRLTWNGRVNSKQNTNTKKKKNFTTRSAILKFL